MIPTEFFNYIFRLYYFGNYHYETRKIAFAYLFSVHNTADLLRHEQVC